MRKFTARNVPFYVVLYAAVFAFLLALLVAPWLTSSPSKPEAHVHQHMGIEHPATRMPDVAISLLPDAKQGWNLTLQLTNFTFTPQQVNQNDQANIGHAHLYINGEKVARLYSRFYHIAQLPEAGAQIRVTLNSNNHATWLNNGDEISATVTLP
ncbi:hypothetical protein [Salinibius halmophilus]|uniref:hypothetical protein n=1 Tax=Salinibius halmophilus TaxID=1853216 RepID=UPI000E666CB4|nr:hypothetical protein [Salinibius halmophilus]